jgi:hypothetical protein
MKQIVLREPSVSILVKKLSKALHESLCKLKQNCHYIGLDPVPEILAFTSTKCGRFPLLFLHYKQVLYKSRGSDYNLSLYKISFLRGPFEKFVDWRQCDALMQREAVTLMSSCSGGGNVVLA